MTERTGWSLSLPFGGHFCIAATPALSWRSNPFREQSDDPWTTYLAFPKTRRRPRWPCCTAVPKWPG
ncbi:hypothetical protein FA454_23080 [Pseudomonas aeruginosa]|nr:hypothetical protein [Pseudomonas aeruginosa]MCO1780260.1 hypothetical protein [Pseudomonas aeruginosa]MCO1792905.1 hypothetical protein [Pseudomonas aeruginosa]MCO1800886.1 hypothetical protein [Pseudomonas aeruginosa]MDV6505273.1 hypothetical protein [Pseudomonas aeruginosa]